MAASKLEYRDYEIDKIPEKERLDMGDLKFMRNRLAKFELKLCVVSITLCMPTNICKMFFPCQQLNHVFASSWFYFNLVSILYDHNNVFKSVCPQIFYVTFFPV